MKLFFGLSTDYYTIKTTCGLKMVIMDDKELAEHIRKACIKAAREGFLDASMSGLCTEGAMEAAISAMQSLDIEQLIEIME
ncbi:hypothetical protein [Gracilimonas halophila]|uniref:Acetyltransferase n=1 Tax=Gracilimonas halophila TaxID=1834464 RepID=A0ABW5JKT1_9BACT